MLYFSCILVTMSIDSDRPISKKVNEDLIILTSVDGPLYRLVEEVRLSNRLATANQKRLTITLSIAILCLLAIGVSLWMMSASVVEVQALQERQVESLKYAERLVKFAEAADKKIDAANTAINTAPRVVADQKTGQLVVLAPVQQEAESVEVEVDELDPRTKRIIDRKRRRKERHRVPAGKVEGTKDVDIPDAADPDKMKKHIQIPIHMDEVQLK